MGCQFDLTGASIVFTWLVIGLVASATAAHFGADSLLASSLFWLPAIIGLVQSYRYEVAELLNAQEVQ